MSKIKQTERASRLLKKAFECCKSHRHEFIMPEHLLMVLIDEDNFNAALNIFYSPQVLAERVEEFLGNIESIPDNVEYEPEVSAQMAKVIESAIQEVSLSSAESVDIPHLVDGILKLKESWAAYMLKDCLSNKEANFMSQLINFYEFDDNLQDKAGDKEGSAAWKKLVTCMNDHYNRYNPLIGREQELKRTIQVLCRREKNNPLHVGEPGVGKTALVWGLVRLIEEKKVPKRLKGSRIYQLDMGTLLAGTQFRGDFENRIKQIMDGVQGEADNNIVYIDEIHTLVGAGATSDSAMDASNMLKPYLESGKIRFIGSTTYEEYNRHFSRSKGLIRRFQQIDISEPSVDETKNIIRQLQPRYEEFHGVKYDDDAISFAVDASAKYVNDRFLPDKAIDLIDEAGAAMEIDESARTIGKKEIADVLSKTCKVDALSEAEEDDYQQLESLANRMLSQIYGQDEAIRQVVEAVQMSRAGLLDDNKPLASLLFVGPTGVGKTEVARVLSKELGISLVRFDMSEYTEKHTVAKLIGSPAGYVGYEDGGLLTDAIRKCPNCVLLLDEIEKAHQDIYNILLQVMDYARLTDNKGRHADFRNVVLIMTSNAGAQFASQGSIGFNSNVSRGDAMMKQVKKTFKPEFINRLSGAVVFHDMDKPMATLILQKKLRELDAKLEARKVTMTLSSDAFEYLLKEGFTAEYGAREMDRVISQKLKPLLMREILFGSLKKGGNITIEMKDGSLSIG
ncbi:MAG: ATP-dependent Clp protease ATP-binding subunit ClpA [bacterium P3]|nr:MAG: ATP-dependent Clp protease ATP-binding subunit ClpA [bacterium P3]KWW40304.1 MAG: ATP-dependent Clp protease ATP-binding subunit ClpA [bacterium F083]